MKTPASVTEARQKRAKDIAYGLYREYTIDKARQIIKNTMANPDLSEEGLKLWACVRNSFEALVNPPRHKPRSVCVACDQYNLHNQLVKGDLK